MLTLTDSDFQRLYTYIKQHYGIDIKKKNNKSRLYLLILLILLILLR